ncbi:MAG: aromatic ring-hydroxylating dioxygenase subunit alpha [Pseudomonadota bacterium]|nr:aromatic ring-hydroxylating dioxygenase subunit alpha [Pseudomonadota bacterium]
MDMPLRALPDPLNDYRWPAAENEVPKDVFSRDDIYRRELERLFAGPVWHVAAHRAELPNRCDFKTTWVAETPILVVQGDDSVMRAFYNACSHRGVMLETRRRGHAREFECPYHRWLFDEKGTLRACPAENDFIPGFDKADNGLAQIRCEEFLGLVFVTLSDETPPLREYLKGMEPGLELVLMGDGDCRLLGYHKTVIDANWKLYRDNDGYHTPLLHKAFTWLNWQGGKGSQTVTEQGHLAVTADLKPLSDTGILHDPSLLEFKAAIRAGGEGPQAKTGVLVLSPGTLISKALDLPIIRYSLPKGVDRTEIHWTFIAHKDDDPEMLQHRIRQANMMGPSAMISLEDAAVFNRTQKACATQPPNTQFVKGFRPGMDLAAAGQNDEVGNLAWWEIYRRLMGFQREAA